MGHTIVYPRAQISVLDPLQHTVGGTATATATATAEAEL